VSKNALTHSYSDLGGYEEYPKIKRNAARCKQCHTVIESKHRHDFVTCECGSIAVDGGLDYIRWIGKLEDFEDLSSEE
jgi:hypothetical protein